MYAFVTEVPSSQISGWKYPPQRSDWWSIIEVLEENKTSGYMIKITGHVIDECRLTVATSTSAPSPTNVVSTYIPDHMELANK